MIQNIRTSGSLPLIVILTLAGTLLVGGGLRQAQAATCASDVRLTTLLSGSFSCTQGDKTWSSFSSPDLPGVRAALSADVTIGGRRSAHRDV